jgi:hypothetical protein
MKHSASKIIQILLSLTLIFFLTTGAFSQSLEKVKKIKKDSDKAKNEFIKADWQMERRFNNA